MTKLRFFFETNQTGELPIILKRRNNIQTGQNNNDKETDQLDLDTATPTPLSKQPIGLGPQRWQHNSTSTTSIFQYFSNGTFSGP